MTKRERALVKEIKRLIKPKYFVIRIYNNDGVEIKTAWVGDTRYTIEAVYRLKLKSRSRCITFDEFRKIMEEENIRIVSVCEESDRIAKESGENKYSFFEKLLEEAGKS